MSPLETYYDAHATDNPFMDHRLQVVADLVRDLAPQSVLDIGCGRGTLLKALRQQEPNRRYIGSELSAHLRSQAQQAGFFVVKSDIEKGLDLPDESVDCVVFGEVIEHLVDPDAALQHISRVLRKDGYLIVTTPNLASWCNRILLLMGIQPLFTETSLHAKLGRKLRALGQWNATEGHLKIFTLAALCEMLRSNGFLVHNTFGTRFPGSPPFGFLDAFFARFTTLASGLIVVATNGRTLATRYGGHALPTAKE